MLMILRAAKLLAILWLGLVFGQVVQQDLQQHDAAKMQRQLDAATDKTDALDQRIKSLEDMHIERQLSHLETVLDTDHNLLMAIALSVAVMGVEAILRVKAKKPEAKA